MSVAFAHAELWNVIVGSWEGYTAFLISTPSEDTSDPAVNFPDPLYRVVTTTQKLYTSSVKGKELVRLLERHGWRVEHVRGSHHILSKAGKHLSVPVHPERDLGKGLLARLLKEAGLR